MYEPLLLRMQSSIRTDLSKLSCETCSEFESFEQKKLKKHKIFLAIRCTRLVCKFMPHNVKSPAQQFRRASVRTCVIFMSSSLHLPQLCCSILPTDGVCFHILPTRTARERHKTGGKLIQAKNNLLTVWNNMLPDEANSPTVPTPRGTALSQKPLHHRHYNLSQFSLSLKT